MALSRKEFLVGLGGAVVGAPLGAVTQRSGRKARAPMPAPTPLPTPQRPTVPEHGVVSFAQSGEDLIVGFIVDHLKIEGFTYLDIGAYDPVLLSNTYYFYLRGSRGVLVEPNLAMVERLRAVRPQDTTLAAGIGVTAVREADYYLMSEPSWSTFSKEEAEQMERTTDKKVHVEKVVKMPLLDVNEVMAEHFQGQAPTFVSIDAEGLHIAILKSIDFRRFRPKIISVEILVAGKTETTPEVAAFMDGLGYVQRGATFPNGIFVDRPVLKKA